MSSCPYCGASPGDLAPSSDQPVLLACPQCLNPYIQKGHGTKSGADVIPAFPDLRKAAPDGSMGRELLKALPEAIEALPVFPEISQRVLQLTRDPNSSMTDLADCISKDPVLAMKVLRMANSALYGGLQEVKDLKTACARLGMKSVANAVQAIASGNLYATQHPAFREHMRDLWRHAVATAHCANEIATMLAEPRSDMLFVAGLIHEVGRVLVLDIVGKQYRGVLATLHDAPALLDDLFASYSSLVGLHVVQKWGLPPDFAVTTFFHAHPEWITEDAWRSPTAVISLGEAVAAMSGFAIGGAPTSLLGHPATKFLGLTDIKLAMLRADLEEKLAPLLEVAGP